MIFFVTSCETMSTVKRGLTGEKQNTSDEFLIKKKDPLILPPDFSKLPKPNEQSEMFDEEVSIKSVFNRNQNSSKEDNDPNSSKSSIQKSILEKIQKQ